MAASVMLVTAQAATATSAARPGLAEAAALYGQGKVLQARQSLVARLDTPDARSHAEAKRATLEMLLDVCVRSLDGACVADYAGQYLRALPDFPVANAVQRQNLARRAAYYLDYARFLSGSAQDAQRAIDGPSFQHENPAGVDLYLRRQLLAARLYLTLGRPAEAERAVNKALSLLGSLTTPKNHAVVMAWTLGDAMDVLLALGETERAYGLYRVSAPFLTRALPPASLDAGLFHLTAAQILEQSGDLKGAGLALDRALTVIDSSELSGEARDRLRAQAMTLKAVVCTAQSRSDCAHQAVRDHPYAGRFSKMGSKADTPDGVAYLAARAFVGAVDGASDPVAANALRGAAPTADMTSIYRAAGAALALPAGAARDDGLYEAGRRMTQVAGDSRSGLFAAWYRPGAVDQLLVSLALTQAASRRDGADETAFALFQIAARRGVSFDTDALAAMGQARTQPQRRALHQALRLKARRDRFERAQIQKILVLAETPGAPGPPQTSYDAATRGLFRDFDRRIQLASRGLAEGGVSTSGANLVTLKTFQAALGPHEAALAVTPLSGGGAAYMCVRRDGVMRTTAAADLSKAQLDTRLLQAALTAGHAPSAALDSQFPVAAAQRLYDVLIRPLKPCLRAGDHIHWLPSLALTQIPLAVLLDHAPPRQGQGYDLAAADWLVRRYAVSYAGSASVLVAQRSQSRLRGDLDFLGVGDPLLTGLTSAGEDRAKPSAPGAPAGFSLADLAPLPETALELEQSSQGFGSVTLLTQAQATEGGLRAQLIGAYDVMSFATHGLLRDDLQGLRDPALVLTPVSSQDPSDDGLLTASEIADLSLTARFVALSACNTANVDLSQMSQDLPALASAFAVAGVPSVLATLWPVETETSRRVVSAVFAKLRTDQGLGAADALALAQRAFLAAPPSPAYRHPRFWAPFVVLGDGGASPSPASPADIAVVGSLALTRTGGEVVGLNRSAEDVVARFISDPDGTGRHAGGTWSSTPGGAETWRRDSQSVGATRFMARLGSRLVVGGYQASEAGHAQPRLEAFDRKTGRAAGGWTGQTPPGLDGFVMAGTQVRDGKAAFVVASLTFTTKADPAANRLEVFEVDQTLKPRSLFQASPGFVVDDVTLTDWGKALVVTYTQRFASAGPSPVVDDDYDQPFCGSRPVTWVEVYDRRSGRRLGSKALTGVAAAAAAVRGEELLLAGAAKPACALEGRATVLAMTRDLQTRTLFTDPDLGDSEARALSPTIDGGMMIAGAKQTVVDYQARTAAVPSGIASSRDLPFKLGGFVRTIGPDDQISAPKMIDSGSSLFVSALDASDPSDILLGGALGDQAAIIHLSRSDRRAPQ